MKARTALLSLLATAALGLAQGADTRAATPPAAPAAASFTYSRDELLADLSRLLADHYRVDGELQLELLRAWASPAPSRSPLSAQLVEAPSLLTPTVSLRIRLVSTEGELGETAVLLRAQLMRDVWYSRTPLDRGAAFDPSQLDTRRVDTLRERDAVAAADVRAELTYARAVPAGRMLTWRDVSKRALVRKGDVIEVSAVDGMLSVSMKALAMENGSAGETVRVRNLETRKEFSALVVADSRAQVRF